MTSFNIGLFLLAVPAFFAQAETKLRGSPPEDIVQRDLNVAGWFESLGQCRGATCGLWGDPHMITCDGVGFDCQGIGTFNIMDNHMYTVQGRFVDVGAHEHTLIQGWGLTEGASLTNDISVEFKAFDAPIFQFGFGDLSTHDGTFLSEEGCDVGKYFVPSDMPGQGRTVEPTIKDCQERCAGVDGATSFSYWANLGCHCLDGNQMAYDAPHNWPRSVSGSIDECGNDHTEAELADPEERYKHGMIGPRCPLLMHQDGELIDISGVGWNEYYYGDDDSNIRIQNINNFAIMMQYTLENGDKAEVHIVTRGHGPGELWSCHFDFWICLPFSEQTQFIESSKGLMGTPDGQGWNDFIDDSGDYIGLQFVDNWHKTLYNYCYDNHCTQQDDLIVTPPNGQTFEDIKCSHVEYKEFDLENPSCIMKPEEMIEQCEDAPYLLAAACLLECCVGGCFEFPDVVKEIEEVKTLSEDDEDIFYEVPQLEEPDCEGEEFSGTSKTVCPEADTEVVKLLATTGTQDLPGDVFFGIKMDAGDDEKGRTIRFKVNNPFEEGANVYVKYGKSVMGHAFMDPKCDGFELPTGCNEDAAEIEVACHDYTDVDAFALVQVYFASPSVEGTTDIDECCKADVAADAGVVMYSFELLCACPSNALPQ